MLSIPRMLARLVPAPEPSAFFYQRLRAAIESESQVGTVWQLTLTLARYFVPSVAAVTLVLLSILAYQQVSVPSPDLYSTYDTIFIAPDRPQRMIIADPVEITDESVLMAIAEGSSGQRNGAESGAQGK